ncbi:MAG: 2-oxo acid dehydrogenase subunit E2 [Spirochaetaceae bacterium]|nr:2-oxo acid dehydrogenase subunit E2 [Spirochaetaceae bacterium]
MPKTGMAMEEGIIVEWLVKEGDKVSIGDPIAEIETDKSSMELESECDGTILRILYENGSTVPVVETIAWIGSPGEIVSENTSGIKATPAARRTASERELKLENIQPSGRHGEIRESDVFTYSKPKATPLAQRMAASEDVNLKDVRGSGHAGKIFSTDLVKPDRDERVPLTTIQKITGKRMLQSHLEIPAVSMDTQADVTELLKVRKQLNTTLEGKITINDFVLKATAMALEENPRLNSILDGNDVIYKSSINLCMAVATEKGLLVPVVKEVNKLSISQLALKTTQLVEKGRRGKLIPGDMEGGTFTVSNIGIFGITSFTPIINQPQGAILGVCAIEEKLKLIDGEVQARQVMNLSISFDHRIVDGAESSVFFSRIRELLENPLVILS